MEDNQSQAVESKGVEETKAPAAEVKQNESQENGKQDSQKNASAQEGENKAAEEKKPETVEKPAVEEEPKEPGVRKTKLQYIQERKQRQADKKQAKAQEGAPEIPEKESMEEDDLTPEEQKKFDRYMQKTYGDRLQTVDAIVETNVENELKTQVNEFLSTKEGKFFEKHREKIMTWAKHPSRTNIPISTIAMEAVGQKGMLAIGAEMERQAAKEARESQAGGSSARSLDNNGQKKVAEMTNAEFAASKAQVLQKA